MIESLTKIISHFPGASNRACCTAHIVNLVTKIILRQFDSKKKSNALKKKPENSNDDGNANDTTTIVNEDTEPTPLVDDDEDLTSLSEGLDREEQEVADEDENEMSENLEDDLEEIEEVLKEEVSDVARKAKPVQCVLFKVRLTLLLLPHSSQY